MTRPCCKRSRCGTTFQCTNGEMENGYCSQHVLGYLLRDVSFYPFNGHCTLAAISGKDSPTHAASNSRFPFPNFSNRLHLFKRQPFWFHNLNFMVPVKGIVLFNLVFLSHLLFSIHIAFGKCKYCSLFFFFFC